MPSQKTGYKGRFAPSPTGPLHLGSLVAAMASYLDARANKGSWLLRIEDLDPPREIPGSANDIINSLDKLGFEWDESVTYQSQRHRLYEQSVDSLLKAGVAYACECSRRQIALQQDKHPSQPRYPGNCRKRSLMPLPGLAIRVSTDDKEVIFNDLLAGNYRQNLNQTTGDFVIKRKEGFYAYQLAVVIDDAEQQVTHVVRGLDLLESTPRQIHLQRLLALPTPVYAHTPLVMDKSGFKYSKSSNNGEPLLIDIDSLLKAWHFLKQTPATSHEFDNIADFWKWAISQWKLDKLVQQHDK